MSSNDMSPLDLVLRGPEEYRKQAQDNFEHSAAEQLLRALGCPPAQIKAAERKHSPLTFAFVAAAAPGFDVHMHARRVASYSVDALFEAPTKSPVFTEFCGAVGPPITQAAADAQPCAMVFKARGWTKLLVCRGVGWSVRIPTRLVFSVKGVEHVLTSYTEFLDAVPTKRILETATF